MFGEIWTVLGLCFSGLEIWYKELSGLVHMWVLPGGFIDRTYSISTTDQHFVAERKPFVQFSRDGE